ncbi:MAG: lipoprotein signal peptidase, partial [Campylobacterota bacterium]|nr:lipoprotein signal peptidase [Campylobacterota bacterium]
MANLRKKGLRELISLFSIDQYIKSIFVNGFELRGDCISLILAYNKGVAFSMFA